MLALNSGHTIGDVTGPDLVGRRYIELPVEPVRNSQVRLHRLFVGMARRLRTRQPKPFHPFSGTVAAQRNSRLGHHLGNASRPCRALAGCMGVGDLLQQCSLFPARRRISVTPCAVTAAVHPKYATQALHRIALFKSLD